MSYFWVLPSLVPCVLMTRLDLGDHFALLPCSLSSSLLPPLPGANRRNPELFYHETGPSLVRGRLWLWVQDSLLYAQGRAKAEACMAVLGGPPADVGQRSALNGVLPLQRSSVCLVSHSLSVHTVRLSYAIATPFTVPHQTLCRPEKASFAGHRRSDV